MITTLALLIAWIACFTALNVLLKQAVAHLSLQSGALPLLGQIVTSPWAYLAGVLYVACAAFYVVALKLMPLSTAGPIYMTLGVLAAAATGVLYFSEPVTPMKLAGLALCIAGIGVLTLSGAGS